ncbi:retention module-containing protein [Halomonas sp. SCS19]|uniref:retention module-containing protein n=1 Tax=Halomonas sp. SCS19 TaxID=2950870 RepID=UPI0032DEBCB2
MNIIATAGSVWIVDQAGEQRVARPGDVLQPGQRLVAGDDGRVVVSSSSGQLPLVLESGETMEMPLGQGDAQSFPSDELLLAQTVPSELIQASLLQDEQLEEVFEVLESGRDLFDVFDEPDAGPGAGPGNDNGHSFVRLLRILEQVSPLAFEYGLDSSDGQEPRLFLGDIVDGDNPGEEGGEEEEDNDVSLGGLEGGPDGSGIDPDAGDLPGGLEGAELVVRESALAQGSRPSADALAQSSSFNFDTPDGLGALTLGGTLSLTLADLQALEGTPRSLDTPHGILWLDGFQGDATGGTVLYHFELTNTVDNDETQGATDGGFLEQIEVTVTDVDGDGRTASLDVLILDDVPGIELGGPAEVGEGSTIEGSWSAVDCADGVASLVVSVAGIDESFALGQEIVLEEGRLIVEADGSWSFTAAVGLDQGASPSVEFSLVQTDGDGDQADAHQRIEIFDATVPTTPTDGGDPDAAPDEVVLDEDGLDGGIPGGDGDVAGEATVITGALGYDFGDDGPAVSGAFAWSQVGLPALSSRGEVLNFAVSDDGLSLVAATAAGEDALRITLTDLASGAFEVSLLRPLDHPENSTEDELAMSVGYTVADIDGSEASGQLDVRIDDDTPVASVTTGNTLIDANASSGVIQVAEGATVEGNWSLSPGADGFSVIDVLINGAPLSFSSLPGSDEQTTLTLAQGDLTLRGDGSWSFTAASGLDNSTPQNVDVVLRVTDGDGDVVELDISGEILDASGPTTPTDGGDPDAAPAEVVLDEDGLDGGIPGGDGDVAGEATVITGALGYDFGDDGPAVSGAFAWSQVGLPALSSRGEVLNFAVSDDGLSLVAATAAGEEALRITLTDLASGAFEVSLLRPLDHPENSPEDDLAMSVGYTVADVDGSEASGQLDIRIDDDTPVASVTTGNTLIDANASSGVIQVAEGATVEGNWSLSSGADGLSVIDVLINGAPLSFSSLPGSDEQTTLTLAQGDLTLRGDGSWSFTAASGLDNSTPQNVDVVLRVTDGDGDVVELDISGEILDASGPTTPTDGGDPDAAPAEVVLDEDGLDGGIPGGDGDVAGEATVITGALGYDFGDDGPAVSGAFAWSQVGLPALSSRGEVLNFAVSDDGLSLVAATAAGEEALRITLTDLASGAFEVSLLRPLDHPENSTEDDLAMSVGYTVADVDGSEASGQLDIRIDDDAPEGIVSEALLLENGSTGELALPGGYGADGQGAPIRFDGALDGAPVEDVNGNTIMLDGGPLSWRLADNGVELEAVTATGQVGFSVVLDESSNQARLVVGEGELSVFSRLDGDIVATAISQSATQGVLDVSEGGLDSQLVFSAVAGVAIADGSLIVGAGQIDEGDQLRVDMVAGAEETGGVVSWDSHVRVGEFRQSISMAGADNARATLLLSARAYSSQQGEDEPLPLSAGDLRILDQRGVDVTSEVQIDVIDGDLKVEGLQDGWSFVINSAEGIQAIIIEGGNGEPFGLGSVDIVRGAAPGDASVPLPLEAADGDGDKASGELSLILSGPGELVVSNNANNTITTGGGDDVVIADKGGATIIIDPAGNYNLSFILDSSVSMNAEVDTPRPDGSGNYTRLELLKAAMLRQLETLADFEGTLNLQLIDFDGVARNPVVFEDFSSADLAAARAYILGMEAKGSTNFDAGFVASTDFFTRMSDINSFESTAVFVTDGLPTIWLDEDGKLVIPDPLEPGSLAAVEESVASFEALLEVADSVHGIGIGEDSLVDYIRHFDNTDILASDVETALEDGNTYTGSAGEINVVNTEEDLNLALDTGSSTSDLEPLGSDQVFAGAGDDLVFGDTVNSDDLEWGNGDSGEEFSSGEHNGLGYEGLYEFLKWSPDFGNGTAPTTDEVKAYVLANVDSLMNLERQDGGIDELYGEQGDDVLIGGAGQDVLVGGKGDDVLWGGLDSDQFVWDAADAEVPSVDRIEDFTLGTTDQADKLDLSGLLIDGAASDLSSYLVAVDEGEDILLKIKTDGGIDASGNNADLTIELGGLGVAGSGEQVLQQMLDDGQLIVE